jgi:hypothetical protein
MKIYLDGTLLDWPEEQMLKPSITLRKRTEAGDRAFSITGDMVFTGADYTYLYNKLVVDPNALDTKVVLKFVNDCCSQKQTYEFYLSSQTITWCENSCDITASALEKSIAEEQYTCFKNTLVWDNFNGFKNLNHPRMSYCNELRPNWMHDVLILLTIATWTSFLMFVPLLATFALIVTFINALVPIINTIIDAINALGGSVDNMDPIDLDGDPTTNAFEEVQNYVNNLINQSFGCGRKHPSPLVRDYIQNVCNKCGVSFQSSIYNDPSSDYYNAVYVNAPVHKGTHEPDTTTYWIDENAPIMTGSMLLDDLKVMHVGKWEINNNILVFEREDFFIPKTPWVDLTTFNVDDVSICWNWSRKTRYSYANLRYQKDGINWVGGEAIARWSDIVEWNANPYSSLQKGAYEPLIPFAACRFRDDGIDRDVLTAYEDLPTVGAIFKKYKNSMLLNSHNCYTPMLIIWDPSSGVANATANKFTNIYYPGLAGVVGANQYYNFPYWFKDGYPGNLMDRFQFIRNPRYSGFQGFDFTATIPFDCALLSKIDVDGVVRTSRGDTKDSTIIEINFLDSTLTIKGTV